MNDLDFVNKCISGDKESWDAFVDKYSGLVYNYARSTLLAKGATVTQDLLKELFHDIFLFLHKDDFKKLKSFKGKNGCSLASWLRQVAINHTIDYFRKNKPMVSIDEENEEGQSLRDSLADPEHSVEEEIEGKERRTGLRECIERLSTDDKYIVELFFERGIDPEILTRHIGISRSALDMRKSRVLERLRDCFKRKGFVLDS